MPGRLLLRAVSGTNPDGTSKLLRCPTVPTAQQLPCVWSHSRQPAPPRVRRAVRGAVLGDGVPEAVHALLPKVLRGVPVRAGGHLRQQGVLPLLQQLEDQARRTQVPVVRPSKVTSNFHYIYASFRKIGRYDSS